MFLSDLSIKQPVLATMLAVRWSRSACYSYQRLHRPVSRNVEIPVLTVQTVYPGASPETVEREVTRAHRGGPEYHRRREAHDSRRTTEGLSLVAVEFRLGTKHPNGPAGRPGKDQCDPRRVPSRYQRAGHAANRLQRDADRVHCCRKHDGRYQGALLHRREGHQKATGNHLRSGAGDHRRPRQARDRDFGRS